MPDSTQGLIKEIQQLRSSKVLTYIASTRVGGDYKMAQMDIRIFYEHLKRIEKSQKIDLIINSFGGDLTLAWRLVHLIREYCDEYNVIIPMHAFSAATLLAFGADHIVMLPASCLGPTDPQSNNSYNPIGPGGIQLPIDVEDLSSYISLLKKDFELKSESSFVEALRILSNSDNRIHPLALGHTKRGAQLAKKYTKDLLALHMKGDKDKDKIKEIADLFGSSLLDHSHPINRVEAKKYGLSIESASKEIESKIWKLYELYESELLLTEPLNYITEFKKVKPNLNMSLGQNIQQEVVETSNTAAEIESENLKHKNVQEMQITGVKFIDNTGTIRENYSWILKQQTWIV